MSDGCRLRGGRSRQSRAAARREAYKARLFADLAASPWPESTSIAARNGYFFR
jgi:hypothetical protein